MSSKDMVKGDQMDSRKRGIGCLCEKQLWLSTRGFYRDNVWYLIAFYAYFYDALP